MWGKKNPKQNQRKNHKTDYKGIINKKINAKKQHCEWNKPSRHIKILQENYARELVREELNLGLHYHLLEKGIAAGWQEQKAWGACSFVNF